MDVQTHWEKIYGEKAPDAVSWYRPHLETSLALIEQAASGRSASVIDVGGGESTLVDDLLARGCESITVLDISQTAIDANRKRLGKDSERVHWLVANIAQVELDPSAYDVWHDRAVFHFLTSPSDRLAYVRQVTRSVKPGGNVIVSTFGPEGPTKCSGLASYAFQSAPRILMRGDLPHQPVIDLGVVSIRAPHSHAGRRSLAERRGRDHCVSIRAPHSHAGRPRAQGPHGAHAGFQSAPRFLMRGDLLTLVIFRRPSGFNPRPAFSCGATQRNSA